MSSEGESKKRRGKKPFRFLLYVAVCLGVVLSVMVLADRIALANLQKDARKLGIPLTTAELQTYRQKRGMVDDNSKLQALRSLLDHPAFDTDGNFNLTGNIQTIRAYHPEFFDLVNDSLSVTSSEFGSVSDRPYIIYYKACAVLTEDISLALEEQDYDRALESGQNLNGLLKQAAITTHGMTAYSQDWLKEAETIISKYGPDSKEAHVMRDILIGFPDDVQTVRPMYVEECVYREGDQATPTESNGEYAHRVYEARLKAGTFSNPLEVGWGFMEAHAPGYKDRTHRAHLTLVVRTLKSLPPDPSDDLFTQEFEKQLENYIKRKEPGWTDLIETRGWAAGFATTQSDRIKRRDRILASIK